MYRALETLLFFAVCARAKQSATVQHYLGRGPRKIKTKPNTAIHSDICEPSEKNF